MKKAALFLLGLFLFSLGTTSCRENKTESEKLVEEMKADGAEMKVKTDGDETKIKMETDEKEVKIKTEDGETKIKVETDTDDGN